MPRKTVMSGGDQTLRAWARQRKFRAISLKTYCKCRRGYTQARHQLQVDTRASLQQVGLLKRITGRFPARFETGAERGLDA